MRDLLTRLQRALPEVELWMHELQRRHSAAAVTTAESGCSRLREYLPAALLERARAVVVTEIPFPPVAELGLPEFQAMADMPMAGITFGDMYFLSSDHVSEAIHLHELVHVVQWLTLGVPAFLSTYAVDIVRYGYEQCPFEAIAFEAQSRFQREEPMPALAEAIRRHAEDAYADVGTVFHSVGLSISRRTMA